MPPSPLESYEEYTAARASEDYTIIMFTGASCPPCKAIYPVYSELAEKALPGKPRCYTLDAASDVPRLSMALTATRQDAANEEKILGIPTFVLYKSGTKLASFNGADREALMNMFRRTVDLRDVSSAPSFALAAPGTKARRLST